MSGTWGKAGAVIFGLGIALLQSHPSWAAWGNSKRNDTMLKAGDIVAAEVCRADRLKCVCGPGLVTRSFIGARGRFIQCVLAGCPRGQILRESRSAGGKFTSVCEAVQENTYSEPILKKQPAKKSGG